MSTSKSLKTEKLLNFTVPQWRREVFAARGKRVCCRSRQSDQFYNQGIFQDFGHRGVNQPLGSPLPPVSSPLVRFPPLLSHLTLPFSTPSPPLP